MPKIPAITPKKVIKKYKRLGFIHDHTTGSHFVMYHPISGKRVVIPLHLRDIPKGTLSAMLRESGINREEFLSA